MKLNFLAKQYNPLLVAGAVAGGLQTVMGTVQAITGGSAMKKLQQRVEAYKTPDEVFSQLNAAKNMAQYGLDPATLGYLTQGVEQGFSESADVMKRLGGDANQLSALFAQRVQGMMKIGAENHAQNMKNFGQYMDALGVVAANKAAEQKSKQDILKDRIQAAAADKAAGMQNIAGGINTALGAISASETMDLYKDQTSAIRTNLAIGDVSSSLFGGAAAGATSGLNPASAIPKELSAAMMKAFINKLIS